MNIKILHYPYSNPVQDTESEENSAPNKYTLKLTDNILSLSITTQFNAKDINASIDIDLTQYDTKAFEVMLRENDKSIGLDCYEIMRYVDRDTALKNVAYNGCKIARGYVENGEAVVLLLKECDPIDGFENEAIDRSLSSTGWLLNKCPNLAERYTKLKKKASMLNNVDLYRSVSYLEAQVDLLTRIVLKLTEGQDIEGRSVLMKADENSVLGIKPSEALLLEFTENKKYIREIQEKYYEDLQG